MALELPQSKRTRRPSVRLGEIGELGFTSSWLYSRSSRKLQQLPEQEQNQQEQVQEEEEEHEHKREQEQEQEQEQEHQEEQEDHHLEEQDEEQEEEWSVVEVAVGGASPVVVAPASTPIGKRRSGGGRVRRTGSKARGRQEEDVPAARSEPPLGKRLDPEDDEGLFRTAMSSDSDGRGLTELPGPRFGGGAHPNGHGDEMQGAIEDGPDGRGFRTGERRSGRPGARRKHRIASRETVSRDTSAEEPVVAPIANGTIVVTPSSRPGELQRITLTAGVSGWLQELGLGKYAELFELNEVDTEVLPLLTLDDLREMGVEAVGARRKMFTNIEALRGV